MSKTSVLKRPDNIDRWVLLTHPATLPGTVRDFLKKLVVLQRLTLLRQESIDLVYFRGRLITQLFSKAVTQVMPSEPL